MRWLRKLLWLREIEELERAIHAAETREIWRIVRIAQIRKAAEQELTRIERDGGEAEFAQRVLKMAREAVDE